MTGTIAKIFLVSIALMEMTTMVYSVCNNPRQIMNGRWNASFRRHKLEVGARWEFSCFYGFSLIGSQTMTCQSNGQWSSDVPSCTRGGFETSNGNIHNFAPSNGNIFCPTPRQIMNGRWDASFITNYLEIGAIWEFRCFDGFNLVGSNSMTCDAHGRWTSEVPTCERGYPAGEPSVKQGQIIRCPNLQLPAFSKGTLFFKQQSLEVGTRLVLSCYDGFTLQGNTEITCQSNGKWSGDLPRCVADSELSVGSPTAVCDDPGMRQNSRRSSYFIQNALEVGAKMVFSCMEGFQMFGSDTLTCQSNGQWSASVPRCLRATIPEQATTSVTLLQVFCEDPGHPPGSHRVAHFTNNELESGAKMVFTCNEGFKMEGGDTTTCLPTGLWSDPVPKCLEDDSISSVSLSSAFCQDPGLPPGSRRVSQFTKNELETGAKMVFTCNRGLKMEGRDTTTCLPTGLWSDPVPKCLDDDSTTAISLLSAFCEDPGLPQGARRVAYFARNELEKGAKMVFTCNEGFKMEGHHTTICLPTKQWSSPVPKCLRDDVDEQGSTVGSAYPTLDTTCEDPGSPSNSVRTPSVSKFQLGSRVNYTCDNGYDIQGTPSLVCMYAGKWSSTPPECISNTQKDSCKEPLPPTNGKLSVIVSRTEPNVPIKLTVGSKVQYSCDASYHLDGPDTRECLNQGKWSGPEPKCVIDCGTSKSTQKTFIINGEVSKLGQWPWQAGIALEGKSLARMVNQPRNITFNTPEGSRGIICGGSLISDEWILTAAHCVTLERTTEKYPIEDISVYIGKQFRDPAKDDAFVQWTRVTDISVHEAFNRQLLTADLAMIRMEKLAKFSYRVIPICLPTTNLVSRSAMENGAKGVVSGWGLTEGNVPSEELKHGEISLAPASECETLDPGQSPTEINRVQKDQFCAKAISIDSGYSCLGDSGGPLVFEEDFGGQKRWVVEGIVSWGKIGCATTSSVYIRVKHHMNWLRRFVTIDENHD